MATPSKNSDRRAERTRQMLHQAFLDVVREKGLTKASVQAIVDRANVSRGTFYAHYADKYALIETIMREGFHHSLSTVPIDKGLTRQ
ncbi:MAG: TetR family transcriptional regulator, partial [Chloroflexota bacterium]